MRRGVTAPPGGYSEHNAQVLGRALTGVADYFGGTVSDHLLLLGIRQSGDRRDGQLRLVAVATVGTGILVRASHSLPR